MHLQWGKRYPGLGNSLLENADQTLLLSQSISQKQANHLTKKNHFLSFFFFFFKQSLSLQLGSPAGSELTNSPGRPRLALKMQRPSAFRFLSARIIGVSHHSQMTRSFSNCIGIRTERTGAGSFKRNWATSSTKQ